MNREEYRNLEMETIVFECSDVIVTSCVNETEDD